MGFFLTFYSVDKDTVLEPVTGEGGVGKTFEYDEVFNNDAVSPKRIASWKNQHTLAEIMAAANLCSNDDLGPWVITKNDIPLIVSEITARNNEQTDDRWNDYEGLKLFLILKNKSFDFDKDWFIFTAG
ncbi:hypothetical protein MOA67_gp037 [Klebsiella phage KpLz-2_45]|uniref:hypothetical protein n=1 Tax=Klebsiella phage KpLz-2_45 TaxID=2698923 RepID=UPI001F13EB2C|nr:hypothetical protein MOA67_gp037 [Klebsiella phage KpLz-2_45]UKS71903.1 hypothetical protein KpLz245_0370 [Klebsiella phage KpLz-2_45]